MEKKWRVGDLIDLEYFLQDNIDDKEDIEDWDRKIYLAYMDQVPEEAKDNPFLLRRGIFRYWLEKRKARLKETLKDISFFPGEIFEEVNRIFTLVFLLIGILSGGGLAFSVLYYDGTRPINVTMYLGIFVICQIILAMLVILLSLAARKKGRFLKVSVIYRAIGSILAKVALILHDRTLKKLSAEKQSSVEVAIGLARGKGSIYGSVFFWPIFILIQIGNVGFNIGVFASTLLRVLSQDLAFGWESTIQFSSETVFGFVRLISIPWSWVIPKDIAYPTLAQIEGSKIVLKNGIYHLATQDLVSWWPFLCLSVLFYGLLPRLMFLVAGLHGKRKSLAVYGFDSADCERVMIRMKTPGLRTQGQLEVLSRTENEKVVEMQVKERKENYLQNASSGILALVPTDIFEECSEKRLAEEVLKDFGSRLINKIEIGVDPETDSAIIKKIAKSNNTGTFPDIIVIQEAWQPPIQEIKLFLKELRKGTGQGVRIIIGLIGKPKAGDIFTQAAEQDKRLWVREITKLGDPYMWAAELFIKD